MIIYYVSFFRLLIVSLSFGSGWADGFNAGWVKITMWEGIIVAVSLTHMGSTVESVCRLW